MVTVADLQDEIAFRNLFVGWEFQPLMAIGARSALRQFPALEADIGKSWGAGYKPERIFVLRALLTAGVAAQFEFGPLAGSCLYAHGVANPSWKDTEPAHSGYLAACAASYAAMAGATAHGNESAAAVARIPYDHLSGLSDSLVDDFGAVDCGLPLFGLSLWNRDVPSWFRDGEVLTQHYWAQSPEVWSFWQRWWDGVVLGNPLPWNLQRDVALIPDAIWQQGPEAVAAAIREIEARHAQTVALNRELAEQPPPAKGAVVAVQRAMQRNRQALPPTFDAIQGLIALEIERLLGRNYTDELDLIECQRQIGIFVALHDAISALRENLPATGPVSEAQAAASESVMRLYCRKFQELPRAKADEVVEGVWATGVGAIKLGLIGATATLAASYGLPILAGATLASMIFAPKNAADLIKAAREALPPKP